MKACNIIVKSNEITCENLNRMLCISNIQQIDVISPAHSGVLSVTKRILLKYLPDEPTQNIRIHSLFLKFGLSEAQHGIESLIHNFDPYMNEVKSYEFLNAQKQSNIPAVYYSQTGSAKNQMTILMEDLSVQYRIYVEHLPVSYIERFIEYLAKFHSKYLQSEKIKAFSFAYQYFKCMKDESIMKQSLSIDLIDKINKHFEISITKFVSAMRVMDFRDSVFEHQDISCFYQQIDIKHLVELQRTAYIREFQENQLLTLLHSDLGNTNILYNETGFKVIDWQWTSRGNPFYDVCHYLFYALSSSDLTITDYFVKFVNRYRELFNLLNPNLQITAQRANNSSLMFLINRIDFFCSEFCFLPDTSLRSFSQAEKCSKFVEQNIREITMFIKLIRMIQ